MNDQQREVQRRLRVIKHAETWGMFERPVVILG